MEVVCYGVIPIRWDQDEEKFLLLKHKKGGFWGFPKGHLENNETPLEAAKRELFEETHLHVAQLLSEIPLVIHYQYQENHQWFDKRVYFYLCLTTDQVKIDGNEIVDFRWCQAADAIELISYKEGQQLLLDVFEKLKTLKK